METDPEQLDSRVAQKRTLEQVVAIPATLYFPTSIDALTMLLLSRNSKSTLPLNGHSALWKKARRSTTPTGGKRLFDGIVSPEPMIRGVASS